MSIFPQKTTIKNLDLLKGYSLGRTKSVLRASTKEILSNRAVKNKGFFSSPKQKKKKKIKKNEKEIHFFGK